MKTSRFRALAVTLALSVALAACGKKEEAPAPVVESAPPPAAEVAPPAAPEGVQFAGLTLGNAVSADQTIATPMEQFAPTDTIYAAVATTGAAPNAAIVARWTFGDGQLVDESSQSIAPAGPATTTFHVSKPDGWPAGKYEVQITIDGTPVANKSFGVQ
jgi:predicted small lipoprotein YifL